MKYTKPIWKKESEALLLSRLNQIQVEEGYCSEERVNELARELDLAPSQIYEVATFYSFLSVHPTARHSIRICNSPSCFVNGSEQVYQSISSHLHIEAGEMTKDGQYGLERTSCIGCCDVCPSALVDGMPITKLTPGNAVIKLLGPYANDKKNGR